MVPNQNETCLLGCCCPETIETHSDWSKNWGKIQNFGLRFSETMCGEQLYSSRKTLRTMLSPRESDEKNLKIPKVYVFSSKYKRAVLFQNHDKTLTNWSYSKCFSYNYLIHHFEKPFGWYTPLQNVWHVSKSVVTFGWIKILTHPC